MFRLGRVWREKYEDRGKKRCGTVRMDETRKWYKIRERSTIFMFSLGELITSE
jgi:hypothetical protein